MSKNKSLNLSSLKKLDSQFNTTKEITLSNDYTILLDTQFRQSRIEEVFNKLMGIHKLTQEDESLKDFPFEKYSLLLLILNFTSLRNIETKSVSEDLQIMNMMIDLDLYKEILERIEIEVPQELQKFNTKMFEIMQEKIDSLKQQQEFYEILGKEMDKQKVESVQQEVVEEGENFAESGTATPSNTETVTTED